MQFHERHISLNTKLVICVHSDGNVLQPSGSFWEKASAFLPDRDRDLLHSTSSFPLRDFSGIFLVFAFCFLIMIVMTPKV